MTKTELQIALAAAIETDKRIAGVFLNTLSALAYKEVKKTWVWQAGEAEKEGSHRLQPELVHSRSHSSVIISRC
jgi:hypothetical protein